MHGTRRQPASGGRNRPSPTSSHRTRRTFRNRAVRQTAARHQAATCVRRQEPTVADEQLSYSSDVPEPRSASEGGTAPGGNQRPEPGTDRRRRAVVILVGRSGTAQCVRRRHGTSETATCSAVVGERRRQGVDRRRLLVRLNAHRPEHVLQKRGTQTRSFSYDV